MQLTSVRSMKYLSSGFSFDLMKTSAIFSAASGKVSASCNNLVEHLLALSAKLFAVILSPSGLTYSNSDSVVVENSIAGHSSNPALMSSQVASSSVRRGITLDFAFTVVCEWIYYFHSSLGVSGETNVASNWDRKSSKSSPFH